MSRIYEVMSNLLGNAIKFTDERRIVISTEMGHEDARQYAIVTIRDAGTGIDPEIMPRLFTKFASLQE